MENMEKIAQGADAKLTKNEETLTDNESKEGHHPHYKNIVHLWEFLMELLSDDRCTSLISWSRKDHGEFKLKNQEEVARRWGKLKQRPGMNYDKLSRALRYYYRQGIIRKVPGQRLVYKFDKLPYEYKPRIVEIRLAKQKQKQQILQVAETRDMDLQLQTNSPQSSSPSCRSSPSSLSNSSPLPFPVASLPQAPLSFLPGNPYSNYFYQSPLIYNSSTPLQSWLEIAQTQALSDSCVSFPRSAPPYITTAKLSSFSPFEQCFSPGSKLTLMRCNSIPVSVITKNNQ